MLVNTQEKHIGRSNGFVEILSYGTLQEYYPIPMEIFMLYIYDHIYIYKHIDSHGYIQYNNYKGKTYRKGSSDFMENIVLFDLDEIDNKRKKPYKNLTA